MTEKKIRAVMIVEIAGKPAEYVRESLENHINKLDGAPNLEIISKNFSEPKKLEQQEAYTCFSEIDFKISNFQELTNLVFDFMPSSIEIIEPGRVDMDSQEATMLVNNLTGRLHRYDEIAKLAQFKIKQLTQQIAMMQMNNKSAQETNIKEKIEIKSTKKEKPSKRSKS